MDNPHKGHRERLRQQTLENGVEILREHQVLELMLSYTIPQKDTNVLAHQLIHKFGTLSQVLDADYESLLEVKGVGKLTAHFLSTFCDFHGYYMQNKHCKGVKITNLQEAKNFAAALFSNKRFEEFYVVCIDSKGNVLSYRRMARGTRTRAVVDVREVMKYVLSLKCSSIMIAHNHPNAPCYPSVEDDRITRALCVNLQPQGIKIIDHIIIGNDGSYCYSKDSTKLIAYEKYGEQIYSNSESIIDFNKISKEIDETMYNKEENYE